MSKREKLSKYGALLGGYGIGVFLNQAINLLLIPVFWSVLTPEDFGIIAITQIITLFLQPIYLFGSSETIQRYYYHWSEEERPHYLSWFFWFIFAFTLLLTLAFDLLGSYFSQYIIVKVSFSPLLRFTLWSTFLSNFINLPIAISRIQQKVKTYNLLVNGSFLTQVAIVYYLVKIENLGAYGYIKGFLIANIIWFFPIVFITLKDTVIFPSRNFINIPLRYAAPISFGGILEGFTTTLDRFFLDKFVPLSTIGFYNLARQFGSLVNIINSVIKLAFIPYLYKITALKKNATHFLGHAGLIYSVVMVLPVLAVTTLSPEVIKILNPSGVYLQIIPFIPYFAVSFYFSSLATVLGRGMDLAGVTKWLFLIPLLGGSASLITYLITLPELGVRGVLWGVVVGGFVRSAVNIILAIKFFPRKLYIKRLAASWILSMLFFEILSVVKIDNVFFSMAVKLVLLLILLVILIRFIIFNNLKQIVPEDAKEG